MPVWVLVFSKRLYMTEIHQFKILASLTLIISVLPVCAKAEQSDDSLRMMLMQASNLKNSAAEVIREAAVREVILSGFEKGKTPDNLDSLVDNLRTEYNAITEKIGSSVTDGALFSLATSIVGKLVKNTIGEALPDAADDKKDEFWKFLYAGPNSKTENTLSDTRASQFLHSRERLTHFNDRFNALTPLQKDYLCSEQGVSSGADMGGQALCSNGEELKSALRDNGIDSKLIDSLNNEAELKRIVTSSLSNINNNTKSIVSVLRQNVVNGRSNADESLNQNNIAIQSAIVEHHKNGTSLDTAITERLSLLGQGENAISGLLNNLKRDIKHGFLTSARNQKAILTQAPGTGVLLNTLSNIEAQRIKQVKLNALSDTEYKKLRKDATVAVTAISFIEPELAKELGAIVDAGFEINKALAAYESAQLLGDTALKVGNLGAAALSGNIVAIGISLFSTFADSGPTPDKIIIEQLQEIRLQLQEIQEQLTNISDQIDESFERVFYGIDKLLQGQKITIAEIRETSSIGLDLQKIVWAEQARIYNAVLGISYRPCIIAMQNFQTFNTSEFNKCAFQLYDIATNLVYSDEIDVAAYENAESIKIALTDSVTAGRTTRSVRDYFGKLSDSRFFGDIASFENWYTSFKLYTEFIVTYPDMARNAFQSRKIGIDKFKSNIAALRQFRTSLLDALEGYESGSKHPFANLNALYIQRYHAMIDVFESEINQYNNAHGTDFIYSLLARDFSEIAIPWKITGLTESLQRKKLSKDVLDAAYGPDWYDSKIESIEQENIVFPNNMKERLLAEVDADIWRLLQVYKDAYLSIGLSRNGASTTSRKSGGILDLKVLHMATSVPYDAYIDFVFRNKASRVATYKIKVPGDNTWREDSQKTIWQVEGCLSQDCIARGMRNGDVIAGDTNAFIEDLISEFESHKAKIGNAVSVALIEMSKLAGTNYSDEQVIRQNAYFSALFRNAFPNVNDYSDVISAIATNQYSFPTTRGLVNAAKGVEIFDVPLALLNDYTTLTSNITNKKLSVSITAAKKMFDLDRVDGEIVAIEEYVLD